MSIFGTLLIHDMADVQVDMDDLTYIREFIDELIDALGMQKMGELHACWLEEPSHLRGWSVCQMIKTSSITMHLCSNEKTIYLDAFSCSEIREQVVKDICDKYWKPKRARSHVIYRDDRLCRDIL